MKRLMIFLILLGVAGGVVYALDPPWARKIYSSLFEDEKDKGYLILYGNIDIRQVDLGFRVMGRLESMPYQEGDLVPAGALMATLDKQPYEDEVLKALAKIESTQASLENAITLVKRRKILMGTGGISEQDIDDAIASQKIGRAKLKEAQALLGIAETNLRDTELYSPSDGTILTRIREPGAIIRVGDPICTLSLISPIWVRTFVDEPQLGMIYPGMPAEVYTDTLGKKPYQGHIGFISPVAEFTPKTVETTQLRTDLVYRLRVVVDNIDKGLRQGMPVTVKIPLTLQEQGADGSAHR